MAIRIGVGLCLLTLGLACNSGPGEHELTVDLRTDFNPGIELDMAIVDIDGVPTGSRPISTADNVTIGARVFEGTVAGGRRQVAVRLTLAGVQVAERRFQLDLNQDVGLIAVISRACAGNFGCGPGMTCIGGVCGSVDCVTGTEAACTGGCFTDANCAPTACSGSTCVSGTCIASLTTSTCESWQYCDPTGGCMTRPGAVPPVTDAGFDSGPPAADPPTDDHLPEPEWVEVPVRLEGECPPVDACETPVQGIWDIGGGCIEMAVAAGDLSAAGCTIGSDITAQVRGRMRVGATQMVQMTEWMATGSLVASGCSVPCNFIADAAEPQIQAALADKLCPGDGPPTCAGCSCGGDQCETRSDMGGYSIASGVMTVSGRTFHFCGDQIQRTDEPTSFTLVSRPTAP